MAAKISSRAATTTLSKVNRDSQTLQHKGRVLGFAEYGSPTGYPVIYIHGYPSSRLDGIGGDKEAVARNIRLICPDRPGYGLSTYQKSRQIIDFPEDVAALADHLRLDKFALIGGSGGGPYALACAQKIPERLTEVGVFAGAPPWYMLPQQKKPWYWKLARSMSINTPGVLGWITMRFIVLTKLMMGTSWASKRMQTWRGEMSQQEAIRVLFNGFTQGPAAAVQETRLLSGDWGLDWEKIKPEMCIWHGTKDINAPIEYIRAMAKALPNARFREFPEEDHYSIAYRLGEYFDEFLPEAKRNDLC